MIIEESIDRQTIVFLPLVQASRTFAEICRSMGLAAMHVDGNSENRKEIIEGFRRKHFSVICNSDLLSTGVDIPSADCLVNLCPTRSASKYQQRVGRIMRCEPGVIDDLPEQEEREERRQRIAESGKPDALILDFLFQDSDFGVMHPCHLVAKNEEEARAIHEKSKANKTPEELAELAKLVLAEKEESLVKALQRSMLKGQKGMVTFDGLALSLRDMRLMEWEPTARWHSRPPSEGQLNALSKWGIDPLSIDSMGRAAALLDVLIERTRAGLASPKQVKFLRLRGVQKPESLTFEQASNLIDGMIRSRGEI
jgi:superfamily II DNA/RNA helicase